MNGLEKFFLFCAGVDRRILDQAPTETNKYVGVGATVFFTGVFAMVASSYALFTVFNDAAVAVPFGVLWGLLIFNLDRYIVSSLKKKGSFFKDFGMALPRIVLAIIISIVISKPLELKIFETEIQGEIISMQQEKRKEHEDLLKSRFQEDLDKVENEMLAVNAKLEAIRGTKDKLKLDALAEADGTGGSKIRAMGKIYAAKEMAAQKASEELKAEELSSAPILAQKELLKQEILKARNEEMTRLEKASLTGFASRMEALSRINSKSQAVFIASIFLMLLFIAIETAPLFVKLISERSPYDYILDKAESIIELDHREFTTKKKLEVTQRIEEHNKTLTHQTKEIILAENDLFSHAIQSEVDQLKKSQHGLRDFLNRGKLFKTAE
jgi:hypothetical protein